MNKYTKIFNKILANQIQQNIKKIINRAPPVAEWVNDLACLCGGASSNPSPVQCVKDPALLQLWCRSQLQLRFHPCPRNFHTLLVQPKRKKKKYIYATTKWDSPQVHRMVQHMQINVIIQHINKSQKPHDNLFVCVCLLRATCAAYGVSQARSPVGAAAASLHQSHSNSEFEPSATYTTVHGSTRSLTH